MRAHAPAIQERDVHPEVTQASSNCSPVARSIGGSPRLQQQAQRMAQLRAIHPTAVLQARWDPVGQYLKCDAPLQGQAWWFNPATLTMAHSPFADDELSEQVANTLAWRPHKEWQIDALKDVNPDSAQVEKLSFSQMVDKGRSRWEQLTKQGLGNLSATTQKARDWFSRNTTQPRSRNSRLKMNPSRSRDRH